MYTFEYTAPGGSYSQTNVQTKSNWSYTPDATRCNDVNSKACRIYATDNDVIPDGNGGYTLNSTFSITASSGSVSHVTATSDGSGSDYISNQSNQ